jgi:hypothetical protein
MSVLINPDPDTSTIGGGGVFSRLYLKPVHGSISVLSRLVALSSNIHLGQADRFCLSSTFVRDEFDNLLREQFANPYLPMQVLSS